jgi:hypothetical protein
MKALLTTVASAAFLVSGGFALADEVGLATPGGSSVQYAQSEIPARPGMVEPSIETNQLPPAAATRQQGTPSQLQPLQQPQQAALPTEPAVTWPSVMDSERATQALNILEGHGYGVFSNFHQEANGFAATVEQNGQSQNVYIDPDSGSVTPQS